MNDNNEAGLIKALQRKVNALQGAMPSLLRQRLSAFLGTSHDGARDVYQAFGYDRVVEVEALIAMYRRNDIAERIVRAFPQATWRDLPTFSDEDGAGIDKLLANKKPNPNYSNFAASVNSLFTSSKVSHFMERSDRLSGLGNFGVLFMGFSDGLAPSAELAPGKQKLMYLSAFGEPGISVKTWEMDDSNPRFGLPVLYQITTGNPAMGGNTLSTKSFVVHHSRCIHIAEFLDDNEVYSTPRLLSVYNRLKDLEKVVGAGAETYWLNSRNLLAILADKDVDLKQPDIDSMKEQAEDFQHQLRGMLAMKGVTIEQISATVADPKTIVDLLLDLIAGAKGIPKRILIGSERGELASSQDENNWFARIDERRVTYAIPMLIRPFIQKMIDTGNVDEPKGEWGVEFDELAGMNPAARAEIGERKARAIATYANSPGSELVVPLPEFRAEVLDMPADTEYETSDPIEEPMDETDPEVIEQFRIARRKALTVNAKPRTLYVRRNMTNAAEFIDWAKSQGFEKTLPADEIHVTIAYSKRHLDWMKIEQSWDEDLKLIEGGPRAVERMDGAVALQFRSFHLEYRHEEMREAGASWDYPSYQPHLTITFEAPEDMDLDKIVPYQGRIELGPEIFEELTPDYRSTFVENKRLPAAPKEKLERLQ